MATVGIIGGSGVYQLEGLNERNRHDLTTPFGRPSDTVREAELDGQTVLFLPRHGAGHKLLPTEVPFAANVYALKQLGATRLLSVSAVGSLREGLRPGDICLPDQFIDRTVQRRSTFFGNGIAGHVSMAAPTCTVWRTHVHAAARRVDERAHDCGTYVCIEGPQFSSLAESNLYRRWGCDVIGMTNATEAKLAREAGLCYATVCFVTDYDCWKTDEEPVSVEQVLAILQENAAKGREVVRHTVKTMAGGLPECGCASGNQFAVVTGEGHRSPDAMDRLSVVLNPIEAAGS